MIILLGSRARQVCETDSHTVNLELILYTIVSDCPQHLTTLWISTACYSDSFTFLYVDDVCTSQETLTGLIGLLRNSFTFLYVDDVPTSQVRHPWASTACYGDSFTFLYVYDVPTSQETRL
jgi:hypothetical protein